ncbi:hypothetical protein HMPREF9444_00501 [Succinatimonas hippei YIT 12066]|uniref:Uncharacterized protein n=1 Tax=Succinatimonas hippei (strain DSM 22608 / JCM 16073 / KCTC 15190 / YIT 12066) TaxID=762983 RepID=E8LII3_SUCHY|nr:hypothetical protein HMPREF9444_00501 [Succinatimonas hippei YIT 12066]
MCFFLDRSGLFCCDRIKNMLLPQAKSQAANQSHCIKRMQGPFDFLYR